MEITDYSARGIFQNAGLSSEPQRKSVDVGKLEAKVNRVSISGVSRIRPGVLNTLSHRIIMAKTVEDVAREAREVAGKLQALGIAKEAFVVMDQARSEEGQKESSGLLVDVGLECVEGKWFSLRTEAGVEDNEGTAGVTGRLLNIFGGGESADVQYARGSKTQAAFHAGFAMPVAASPDSTFNVSGMQRMVSCRPYSEHDETHRELLLGYKTTDPLHTSVHDLAYSLTWRNICNLGTRASPTLRTEAGHSLKSSLWHTLALDTRDSARVPTHGSLLKLSTEFAGLIDGLGDTRFVKTRAEFQTNQDLGSGFTVSTGLQGGLLWNLDPARKRSRLADRFFLGGSTSVRGFEYHGIGPRDGNDSIGGDAFYAAGISLLTPLPFVKTDMLKGHVWANAGQLALLDSRGLLRKGGQRDSGHASARREIHRFLMSPSAAVGVGLVYNHSIVRAELSLCFPITATPTDRPKVGPQFGLGLVFL
ncbi:hypothetical protein EV178_001427 [Coemansia sp. RSA 1646]|nr:hypothetical protein EV178_001427 [Coemansia sp. RSA 1646]KAJ2093396.1 hypothetical protein IW138_000246 [Coemansia sp. RSA 986]